MPVLLLTCRQFRCGRSLGSHRGLLMAPGKPLEAPGEPKESPLLSGHSSLALNKAAPSFVTHSSISEKDVHWNQ